jgi:hypothetical protein
MALSGAFRALREGRKSCLPNEEVVAPYYWGNPAKVSRDGLYMPTLWEGGRLGVRPADVPGIGDPEEKELCAGPPPLSVLMTDQADATWYFREVFNWDLQ